MYIFTDREREREKHVEIALRILAQGLFINAAS